MTYDMIVARFELAEAVKQSEVAQGKRYCAQFNVQQDGPAECTECGCYIDAPKDMLCSDCAPRTTVCTVEERLAPPQDCICGDCYSV